MTVLLFPDAHVVIVLAEPARQHGPLFRLALAVKLAGPRGPCGQTRELGDRVSRDLEETRPRAIADDDEDGPDLLLESHELPDEWHRRDREARPMHVGQRKHVEQIEPLARE